MNMDLLQDSLAFMADVSLKSLLIGLLAWLAIRLARDGNMRNRVAAVAMLGMLSMPILVLVTPPVPLAILASASSGASSPPTVPPLFSSNDPSSTSARPDASPAGVILEPGHGPGRAVVPTITATTPSDPSPSWWPLVLFMAYAAGAALLLARLVLGLFLARGLVRASRPIPNMRGFASARATLRESDAIRVPMMLGVIRPRILLPVTWTEWDTRKLDSVLTHESAHAERGDWLVSVLSQFNRAIYWFHPVAWILNGFLERTAEECCDDAVIGRLDDRFGYARHLLDFAGEETTADSRRRLSSLGWPLALSMARRPMVEDRINSILATERPLAHRISLRMGVLLGSVALASTLFAASLVAAAPPIDPPNRIVVHSPADPTTKDAGDIPIELTDTPEVHLDGEPALRIRVLDAETNLPLESFLAIAGSHVREEMLSPDVRAKHGKDSIVNWQAHLTYEGKDGESLRPIRRMYPLSGLRVQAHGYVPMRYTWIDKSRGAQTIVFRLRKDPHITGQVLMPNGEPAAGAEIGIKMVSRGLTLDGCTFGFESPPPRTARERFSRGVVVKADAKGRFRLPTESDASAYVVAIHESGTHQVPFDEFKRHSRLDLVNWGRVEGKVLIGESPGAGEKVIIHTTHRFAGNYISPHMFDYHLECDAAGRFAIERFPTGPGLLALPEYIPVNDGSSPLGWSHEPRIPENARRRFHVRPGETTVVTIGGDGLGNKQAKRQDKDDLAQRELND